MRADWRQSLKPIVPRKKSASELVKEFLIRYPKACRLLELSDSADFRSRVNSANNFGLSYGGAMLYSQCGDEAQREPGAMVMGDGYTFGLGVYQKDGLLTAHIVGPSGPLWVAAIPDYTYWLLKHGADRVYVRHVRAEDATRLSESAFLDPRSDFAWCADAPYEDETYSHRLLNLAELVDLGEQRCNIRPLGGNASKNFRFKFRHAYSRFQNFLSRNNLIFELIPIESPQQLWDSRDIVERHFSHLEACGRAVGSTALDYKQLLLYSPSNSDRFVSLIGQLRRDNSVLPVSIFLGERTSSTNGGLYCTITDRDVDCVSRVLGLTDNSGFTAIGQYAYARVFAHLLTQGWQTVDLGGSETVELDRFKQQLGCVEVPSVWRVCTPEQIHSLEPLLSAV